MPDNDRSDRDSARLSRRGWFRGLAGTGVGLGLSTWWGRKRLIGNVSPQKHILPGVATWFATSCRECPAGCGMLIRNREGRAVKAEGNPQHPTNAGALCARGQASLQGLCDPDRITSPEVGGRMTAWDDAIRQVALATGRAKAPGRVAVISDLQTGSMAALIREFLALHGSDRYLQYEPLNYESIKRANDRLLGRPVVPVPNLNDADFVLSLGADLLDTWLSPVEFTRWFAESRPGASDSPTRLVYAGPRMSLTAANADERFLVRPGDKRFLARSLLNVLEGEGLMRGTLALPKTTLGQYTPERVGDFIGVAPEAIRRLARRMADARRPVVVAGHPSDGSYAAEGTVLAANLLNLALESRAVTLGVTHAIGSAATREETKAFVDGLAAGEVDTLIIVGADPVAHIPPELGFTEALNSVGTVICLSPFPNETTELADCVLPIHTPLESWGDFEPRAGVLNLMQPTMGALHDTRNAGDLLLESMGSDRTYVDYVRGRYEQRHGGPSWAAALEQGGVWDEAAPYCITAQPQPARVQFGKLEGGGIALHTYPSTAMYDGRGANRRWLQELPDPMTKLAWTGWAEVSPDLASELGISTGDEVSVETDAGAATMPAYVYPGLAARTVAVPIGHGSRALGASGAVTRVTRVGDGDPLPSSDGSPYQHARDIVQTVALASLAEAKPAELHMPLPEGYDSPSEMNPPHDHVDYRWAMAIDLAKCTGCSACVTACYAENNIGVVGKELFTDHRSMAWMRIDRYYDWSSEASPVLFQPMLCQQCDAAPCEPVCPVYAAAHNENGLNMQVYNRCVGTRYCANNCPYKVRRFNWTDYEWPEPLNLQANPDVTVRCRGVMEKCTFCIQRIRSAGMQAKREDRKIRDGEVIPACAQTCPANAIIFGNLMDPESEVSKAVRENPRAYQVLHELNTKPAVFYLKRVVADV